MQSNSISTIDYSSAENFCFWFNRMCSKDLVRLLRNSKSMYQLTTWFHISGPHQMKPQNCVISVRGRRTYRRTNRGRVVTTHRFLLISYLTTELHTYTSHSQPCDTSHFGSCQNSSTTSVDSAVHHSIGDTRIHFENSVVIGRDLITWSYFQLAIGIIVLPARRPRKSSVCRVLQFLTRLI